LTMPIRTTMKITNVTSEKPVCICPPLRGL
jgi:hypothetical protein